MAQLKETNINGPLSLEDTIGGGGKIEDVYAELIDLIKEEDSNVNLSNTVWKPSVYNIKRIGHNVEVNYYVRHSEAAATAHRYVIGLIPDGLRPNTALSFPGWCCDNNGNRYAASVDIYSNGTISMVGGTGFIEFGFHIIYMI